MFALYFPTGAILKSWLLTSPGCGTPQGAQKVTETHIDYMLGM